MCIIEHINELFRKNITNKEKHLHKLWVKHLINDYYSENMEELSDIINSKDDKLFNDLIQKEKNVLAATLN